MDPRFMRSNLVEGNGFLRTIKIHSTQFYGRVIKTLAPCQEIFSMLKNPLKYERDTP
jgi:hypothetical protein